MCSLLKKPAVTLLVFKGENGPQWCGGLQATFFNQVSKTISP